MTISARIVCDSCQGYDIQLPAYGEGYREAGYKNRLTTFVLRYPRFIHAEFMTHRVFSRNAASSRAIPVAKMIQAVIDDPAMPVYWGKNQSGMQAAEELSSFVDIPWRKEGEEVTMEPNVLSPKLQAMEEWLRARDYAVMQVRRLMDIGLHKQIANRILEPWSHIEVVATATDFANFYALRNHPMAQPEFQELARKMYEAHTTSVPKVLQPGQWHLPFFGDTKEDALLCHPALEAGDPYLYAKLSAARCARVSYLKHDGERASVQDDLGLYDRLMGGNPKHASPTEHQARCPNEGDYFPYGEGFEDFKYPSNLHEWVQFRKLIEGENVSRHEGFSR